MCQFVGKKTIGLIITMTWTLYLQVFIEVVDVNDHVPLTVEPIYWASVAENSAPKTAVVRIDAVDADRNANQTLRFALKAGNPQSLFDIDPKTGDHHDPFLLHRIRRIISVVLILKKN